MHALDISDGEALRIENCKWIKEALHFITIVPSNGWVTKSKFAPIASNPMYADREITTFECWKKKSPPNAYKMRN